MMKGLKIGITDAPRYGDFYQWIWEMPGIEVVHLAHQHQNGSLVEQLDGVLLTGGQDIHPKFYGVPEAYHRLNPNMVDEPRDLFELDIIGRALNCQKPVLGICRGMQLMNVFLGGTMVVDLLDDTGIDGHTQVNDTDQRHGIEVLDHSPLVQICGTRRGVINSSHHQAVAKLGEGLTIGAVAAGTGVPESIHWEDPAGKSWVLLVQWHPERMPDQDNPFAQNIRNAFLTRCLHEKNSLIIQDL